MRLILEIWRQSNCCYRCCQWVWPGHYLCVDLLRCFIPNVIHILAWHVDKNILISHYNDIANMGFSCAPQYGILCLNSFLSMIMIDDDSGTSIGSLGDYFINDYSFVHHIQRLTPALIYVFIEVVTWADMVICYTTIELQWNAGGMEAHTKINICHWVSLGSPFIPFFIDLHAFPYVTYTVCPLVSVN